jgi:hypothetical protein
MCFYELIASLRSRGSSWFNLSWMHCLSVCAAPVGVTFYMELWKHLNMVYEGMLGNIDWSLRMANLHLCDSLLKLSCSIIYLMWSFNYSNLILEEKKSSSNWHQSNVRSLCPSFIFYFKHFSIRSMSELLFIFFSTMYYVSLFKNISVEGVLLYSRYITTYCYSFIKGFYYNSGDMYLNRFFYYNVSFDWSK